MSGLRGMIDWATTPVYSELTMGKVKGYITPTQSELKERMLNGDITISYGSPMDFGLRSLALISCIVFSSVLCAKYGILLNV